MAEQDWNNNGDAIDAMLDDAQTRHLPLPTDPPIATGPFPKAPLVARVDDLVARVTILEAKIGELT